MAHFTPPTIQQNDEGWGPAGMPEQFKDMPYQPFSKGDRLGKVRSHFHQPAAHFLKYRSLQIRINMCSVCTCCVHAFEYGFTVVETLKCVCCLKCDYCRCQIGLVLRTKIEDT